MRLHLNILNVLLYDMKDDELIETIRPIIDNIQLRADKEFEKRWLSYLEEKEEKQMISKMEKVGFKNHLKKIFQIAFTDGYFMGYLKSLHDIPYRLKMYDYLTSFKSER